jgi:hypothetical protein
MSCTPMGVAVQPGRRVPAPGPQNVEHGLRSNDTYSSPVLSTACRRMRAAPWLSAYVGGHEEASRFGAHASRLDQRGST